jgi:hypothetical protein
MRLLRTLAAIMLTLVLTTALAPVVAQAQTQTQTQPRTEEQSAQRERIRANLIFLLSDETRLGPDMVNRTEAQRRAIRRLAVAMFNDDVVLDQLMRPEVAQPTTPDAAMRLFMQISMNRSKIVETRLDDADLDEVETSTPEALARMACPGLMNPLDPDVFRSAANQVSAHSLDLIAKAWEALDRGDPEPVANEADLVAAVDHLNAAPEARAAIAALGDKASASTRSPEENCEQIMTVRRAMLALPRAERVALLRFSLAAQADKAEREQRAAASHRPRPSVDASALLQPPDRVFQFADMKLDLDDERSIAAAVGLDPHSPLLPAVRRVFVALAANRTARQLIAHATDPGAPWTAAKLTRAIRSYAFEIVLQGLRRLDDETLLAERPLLQKVLIVRAFNCTTPLFPVVAGFAPPDLTADEQLALLDMAALGIDAINRHQPVIVKPDAEFNRATVETVGELSLQEAAQIRALVPAANPADTVTVTTGSCGVMSATGRMALSSRTDSTAPMRAYLKGLMQGLDAPKPYAPGEALRYPRPGLEVGAEGRQTVDVKVDGEGRVIDVKVTSGPFVPAMMILTDGTEAAAAPLFESEVEDWVRNRSFKDKLTDPTRKETNFEFPVTWKMPP